MPHLTTVLQKPLELPCGVVLKNRLAKAAMSDSLGNGEGNSTEAQGRMYERWAEGGAALSIIGEVQGDYRYPERPGNLVLGDRANQQALRSLAQRGVIQGAHLWPQLGHAGALSHLPISKARGPSALRVEGLCCEGMSVDEIKELPGMYTRAALQAKTAGFSGVQLHAGHGFLLNQFLSPLFNHRADGYGGSVEARCRIVLEVVTEIRKAVGPLFPVGIKINSTDKLEGGITEADALELVRMLDQTSIDLIDISGGTYFPGAKSSSDSGKKGGPYFFEFCRLAKEVTQIPLMLTGGFETREQAITAVSGGTVDLVGLARAMVLNPRLANIWLTEKGGDPDFPTFESPPPGGVTAWYTMRITTLSKDKERNSIFDPRSALLAYEERDAHRCAKWAKKFL